MIKIICRSVSSKYASDCLALAGASLSDIGFRENAIAHYYDFKIVASVEEAKNFLQSRNEALKAAGLFSKQRAMDNYSSIKYDEGIHYGEAYLLWEDEDDYDL